MCGIMKWRNEEGWLCQHLHLHHCCELYRISPFPFHSYVNLNFVSRDLERWSYELASHVCVWNDNPGPNLCAYSRSPASVIAIVARIEWKAVLYMVPRPGNSRSRVYLPITLISAPIHHNIWSWSTGSTKEDSRWPQGVRHSYSWADYCRIRWNAP